MSIDLINNLLEKLKAKTGRDWSIADLMMLAQKLPDLNANNIDGLLKELDKMGLELPENAKEKVMQKLEENPDLSLENIPQVKRKIKPYKSAKEPQSSKDNQSSKDKSDKKSNKKSSTASSTAKTEKKKSLLEQVKKMQKGKTKKKK